MAMPPSPRTPTISKRPRRCGWHGVAGVPVIDCLTVSGIAGLGFFVADGFRFDLDQYLELGYAGRGNVVGACYDSASIIVCFANLAGDELLWLASGSPFVGGFFGYPNCVDPIGDLFDRVAGGEGKFAEKPFCKVHISPIISPMRYGEDAVAVGLRHLGPVLSVGVAEVGQHLYDQPAAEVVEFRVGIVFGAFDPVSDSVFFHGTV